MAAKEQRRTVLPTGVGELQVETVPGLQPLTAQQVQMHPDGVMLLALAVAPELFSGVPLPSCCRDGLCARHRSTMLDAARTQLRRGL